MSTRQYIGARYVPKFYQNSVDGSAAWESNVVYEPLTWVTLTNGHIYLSRKQVPATVGIPSQNVDYWLDVGSYNGFIEGLQDQIDDIVADMVSKTAIAPVENGDNVSRAVGYSAGDEFYRNGVLYIALTTIPYNTAFSGLTVGTDYAAASPLAYQIKDVSAHVDKVDKPTKNCNFLLMGDSFGPTSTWPTQFANRCDGTVYDQTEGARTFVSSTSYLAKIQTFVAAHTSAELAAIDYLILLGGIGDSHPDSNTTLRSKISEFLTYAKANLPNAKIYLGYIGGGLTGYGGSADVGNATPLQQLRAAVIYDDAANINKCDYIAGIQHVLKNYRWYKGSGEDGLHPLAATGIGNYIANYVYNYIATGSASYLIADSGAVTVGSNSVTVEAYQDGNITEINIPKFTLTLGSDIGENGTKAYKVATMPAWSPIWGSDLIKIDTRVVTGTEAGFVPLYLYIYKHDLYITNFEKKSNTDWWDIPSGSYIEIPDVSIKMCTDMVLKAGYDAHG